MLVSIENIPGHLNGGKRKKMNHVSVYDSINRCIRIDRDTYTLSLFSFSVIYLSILLWIDPSIDPIFKNQISMIHFQSLSYPVLLLVCPLQTHKHLFFPQNHQYPFLLTTFPHATLYSSSHFSLHGTLAEQAFPDRPSPPTNSHGQFSFQCT